MIEKLKHAGLFLRAFAANFLAEQKLRREDKQNENKRMHWRAGRTGGSLIELGYCTKREAVARLRETTDESIIFIDADEAFIAYGATPKDNSGD